MREDMEYFLQICSIPFANECVYVGEGGDSHELPAVYLVVMLLLCLLLLLIAASVNFAAIGLIYCSRFDFICTQLNGCCSSS